MKILKKLVAVMAVTVGILSMSITASASNISNWSWIETTFTSIKDSAITVKNNKTYSATVEKLEDRANFKIVCKTAGTLTVELETATEQCNLDLLTSKGYNIESTNAKAELGTVEVDENKNVAFTWDKSKETVKCTVQYKVKKGTYYLSLWRNEGDGSGETTVKVTIPTSKIASYFTVDVKKGQSLTLSAGSGLKWSSSNTAVATVSANGKVTGKSKGTAVITATDGSKKLYIAVKVS